MVSHGVGGALPRRQGVSGLWVRGRGIKRSWGCGWNSSKPFPLTFPHFPLPIPFYAFHWPIFLATLTHYPFAFSLELANPPSHLAILFLSRSFRVFRPLGARHHDIIYLQFRPPRFSRFPIRPPSYTLQSRLVCLFVFV